MTEKEYLSLKAGDIVTTSKTGVLRMILECHKIKGRMGADDQWVFLEQIPRPGKTTLFLKRNCQNWKLIKRGRKSDLPKLYEDPFNRTLRVDRS